MSRAVITINDVFQAFVISLVLVSVGLLVAFGGLGADVQNLLIRPQSPDERFKSEVRDWLDANAPESKLVELVRPMRGPKGKVSLAKIQTKGSHGDEVTKSLKFRIADNGSIITTTEVDGEAEKRDLGIETIPASRSSENGGGRQ